MNEIRKIEKTMSKFFKSKASINVEKMGNKDKCWLCKEGFGGQAQIQHYCKLTDNYLGNAHNQCINKAEAKNKNHFVHVLFHNLEGYDSHIFVNDLINIVLFPIQIPHLVLFPIQMKNLCLLHMVVLSF